MKAHGHGDILAPMVKGMAEKVSVPVAFNLDHGADLEDITAAMKYGFSSVMIDSSSYDFEENVRRTQLVASLAHRSLIHISAVAMPRTAVSVS